MNNDSSWENMNSWVHINYEHTNKKESSPLAKAECHLVNTEGIIELEITLLQSSHY